MVQVLPTMANAQGNPQVRDPKLHKWINWPFTIDFRLVGGIQYPHVSSCIHFLMTFPWNGMVFAAVMKGNPLRVGPNFFSIAPLNQLRPTSPNGVYSIGTVYPGKNPCSDKQKHDKNDVQILSKHETMLVAPCSRTNNQWKWKQRSWNLSIQAVGSPDVLQKQCFLPSGTFLCIRKYPRSLDH